jgi:hypothetical protein
MLPADQNVSWSGVVFDRLFNAFRVVTVTRSVHGGPQIICKWFHGVEWPLPCTIFGILAGGLEVGRKQRVLTAFVCLGYDVPNIIVRSGSKNGAKALGALQSLSIQAAVAVCFLPVAYQVYGGL